MKTLLVIAALIVGSAQAADRFPVLAPEQLTPEQQKLIQALMAGPRGGGEAGPARPWSRQYEWSAPLPLALKAGLDPQIAADLAENRRPRGMKDDEAAIYAFCVELHRKKKVSDAAYRRVVALFGEKGAMDLIGVSGYYTAVSMTLNVAA